MNGIRRAFTLVEVLVAVTLASVVMLGVLTAIRTMQRASGSLEDRERQQVEVDLCLRLLREDLLLTAGPSWSVMDHGRTLTVHTVQALPGEFPGAREVSWRPIPGGMVRQVIPQRNGHGGGSVEFTGMVAETTPQFRIDGSGALWLDLDGKGGLALLAPPTP